MRRAFGIIAILLLGIGAFAAAAYTLVTAMVSLAFLSPLGVAVLVAGVLVTIGLVTLMKRVAAATFGT